jgi:hypothetical protein
VGPYGGGSADERGVGGDELGAEPLLGEGEAVRDRVAKATGDFGGAS